MSDKFEKKDSMSLDAYKVLRSYIDEENKLLNYRVTWLLTINGFLFASYAIILQKKIDASKPLNDVFSINLLIISIGIDQVSFFLCVLCFLGLLICYNSMNGIRGARRAVNHLENFVDTMYHIHSVELINKSVSYEGKIIRYIKRAVVGVVRKTAYSISGRKRRDALIHKSDMLQKKSFTYCLYIKEVGLFPFITGGGYYTRSRRTKMISLMLSKFLLGCWVLLIIFALLDRIKI